MEYMYSFAIAAHLYSVYGMVAVILLNVLATYQAQEITKFRKMMLIFTPMGSVMLASAIFTGIVLMAAKHLDFDVANVVMIIFSVVMIILEAKRAKLLRFSTAKTFLEYKKKAYKLLAFELAGVVIVSIFVMMVV